MAHDLAALLPAPLPAASPTHADRLFRAIEQAIVSGEFPTGSRLGEEALAARFGVSRGPLREALRQLEGRGLVVRLPHSGVRVASLTTADLIEIYQIRANLEGLACRLAAERATAEGLDALMALLERHAGDARLQAGEAYVQEHGDFDFHYAVAMLSGSRRLQQLLCHDYYSLIRLFRFHTGNSRTRVTTAYKDHLHICEALHRRDGELAEMLMRRHVDAARRELEAMQLPARPPG
jgi:DNA-binding GntR family transcriptional regulator